MSEAIQPSPAPFYTVLAIYLGIMAFIGWYASRKTKNIGDFFVLSGKAGVILFFYAVFHGYFPWHSGYDIWRRLCGHGNLCAWRCLLYDTAGPSDRKETCDTWA